MRTIYATARSLDVDNDSLHSLVACLTGKESIKALTFAEAGKVAADLAERQKQAGIAPPPSKAAKGYPTQPGGVTKEQQRKMWALIGELEKLDAANGTTGKGDHRQRLCGAIKKATGQDAAPSNPFKWLTMRQGIEVIDLLKRIATSEEKKALRKGCVGHG
ncbi:regulatory protein GemA [Ruminococcaceae bacterium OttesenSCG-928-A11]|nr:regulatory protein GemA [Ruminococcaceae bacterium OttesenSCG-928-A11]